MMKSLNEYVLYKSIFDQLEAKSAPSGVLFELTYGCNFRCVHCYNPTHRAKPEELKTHEIFRILDEIKTLGVLSITFTGGELFTRPDIFQVLEYAKKSGLLIDIFTNASFLTQAVVQNLDELGIRDLSISIYGTTESTFEKVTGVSGSFKKFKRGLEALSKSSANVFLRMPIMTLNVEEAQEAEDLAQAMGFHFRFFLEIEPRQNGDSGPLRYRLSPEQQIEVMRRLRPKELERPLCESKDQSLEFIPCACGKERFAITPYGEMNLCVSFPIPRFSLRSGTVKEGWRVLQETVRNAKPNENYHCPSCEFKPFCMQGRSDAYLETGDMSACLPYFKEWASLSKQAFEVSKAS